MEWVIGILIVIALLVAALIGAYNGLVKLKTRVEEAWSDIAVQLKYRLDLIPNLVSTVKGYAKHEEDVFAKVTEARAGLMNAKGVAETAQADNVLSGTLKSLFAVAEAYPELKANTNFMDLQQKLTDTEDKIQASRRFYNAGVRDLNTKIDSFPTNIIASMFKFEKREFFEVADRAEAENAPKVEF
ncbi:MAG: LemA family protein [Candidatus Nanosyncoccaceae bacterium]|jgi:LemA protein